MLLNTKEKSSYICAQCQNLNDMRQFHLYTIGMVELVDVSSGKNLKEKYVRGAIPVWNLRKGCYFDCDRWRCESPEKGKNNK